MRTTSLRWVLSVLALVLGTGDANGQGSLRPAESTELPFLVSLVRSTDLDGDGTDELLLVSRSGSVRVMKTVDGKLALLGSLELPDPDRCLVDLADMDQDGRQELVAASASGVRAWSLDPSGAFAEPGRFLAPSRGRRAARFELRTGAPVAAEICRDLNGDRAPDLVLPTGATCEIWIHGPKGEDPTSPPLKRTAEVRVRLRRLLSQRADELSDILESHLVIPRLAVADVNGDGRDDVAVIEGRDRGWHLQQPDGSIPDKASVSVDLGLFRDTTPEGSTRPGRVLAGGDRQSFMSRDLNGDRCLDAVVAHRRKVWVFHGGPDGPQFTKPSQILNAADDITALLLADLDPDGHPDLVILKVLVPDVATLVLSALGSLEVEVGAVGYRAEGTGFERKPSWRSDLVVKLPSITSILKNPAAIIQRFEDASAGLEPLVEADLDGDGRPEIIQPLEQNRSENGKTVSTARLLTWNGAQNPTASPEEDPDRIIRQILFGEADKTWDLDRIVEWVGRLAQSDRVKRTGVRDPDEDLVVAEEGRALIMVGRWRSEIGKPDGLAVVTTGRDRMGKVTILRR